MDEKSTILIVDDDPAGREALVGVLATQGYNLLLAENGMQAIQQTLEMTPDLILLDVMMPGMNGFEVCRRIRSDSLVSEIPILLITALDDRDSRIDGIEAGADDFITKPFDRVELRARVRTVLRLNRYRRLLIERARFVWAIDNDQDGFLILDEKKWITYANFAARRYFNLPFSEDEPIDQPFFDLVQTQYACVPPENWRQWESQVDDDRELYLVRQQQDYCDSIWLELNVLDLPMGSKNQRIVKVQDCTRRMTTSLQTWSFQEAISHKLVTPVSNMIMLIELIRRYAQKQDIEQIVDCVETLNSGVRRMEGEIRDILQYINTPLQANTGGSFSLSELSSLVDQVSQELGIGQVQFSSISPSILMGELGLTAYAMRVILWEILDNAKKYHSEHKPLVTLECFSPDPGYLTVRISDNGIHLSPDQLKRVLTPYFQGEKNFTGEVPGMGLGLSMVASLIWDVGGDIRIYNRVGGPGVVVELRLPRVVERLIL